MNDPLSMMGLIAFAILLPAAILLSFLAVVRFGENRRFRTAAAGAFFLLAFCFAASVIVRIVRADYGPLLWIELILVIGMAFQGRVMRTMNDER